jgi:2TM domain-containing protein
MQTYTDQQLRELAKKRVDFRRHLVVYFIINGLIWTVWLLTEQKYPWPIWPTAGWGVGIIFHYIFDYHSLGFLSEEEEYKKLKHEAER